MNSIVSPVTGCPKVELVGVQGLGGEEGQQLGGEGMVDGLHAVQERQPAAVERIADDGMLEMGQVDADLVRASGLELQFEIGGEVVEGQHLIMGDRALAVRMDAHLEGVAGIAGDGLIDPRPKSPRISRQARAW